MKEQQTKHFEETKLVVLGSKRLVVGKFKKPDLYGDCSPWN